MFVVADRPVDVLQFLDLGAESFRESSGRLEGDLVENASSVFGAVRPQDDVPVDERLEDCTRAWSSSQPPQGVSLQGVPGLIGGRGKRDSRLGGLDDGPRRATAAFMVSHLQDVRSEVLGPEAIEELPLVGAVGVPGEEESGVVEAKLEEDCGVGAVAASGGEVSPDALGDDDLPMRVTQRAEFDVA